MAKILSIIRHAKSVPPDGSDDYQRRLNDRGINDAKLVGEYLITHNEMFDFVMCSSAARAKQTLNQLNVFLNIASDKIIHLDDLYLASRSTICKFIENTDNQINHLAVVAHNPGLTSVCNYYTGDDLYNLPTCGVYTIKFQVDDWQALGRNVGKYVNLVTPKMLKK